jgi:hypothetical protein
MAAAMRAGPRPVTGRAIRSAWRKAHGPLPETELSAALRGLASREVVTGTGPYSFTVDLQRRWLDKHRRLGWLNDELADPIHQWTHGTRTSWTPYRTAAAALVLTVIAGCLAAWQAGAFSSGGRLHASGSPGDTPPTAITITGTGDPLEPTPTSASPTAHRPKPRPTPHATQRPKPTPASIPPAPEPANPAATISNPAKGAYVLTNSFAVTGTAQHLPGNVMLWLVDEAGKQKYYYPVQQVTVTGDSWSVGPGVVCPAQGEQYMQIYSATDSASNYLQNYVNDRKSSGYNPGLPSMPPGTTLLANNVITVPQTDSCPS